mgnify:CR=1 FL=1
MNLFLSNTVSNFIDNLIARLSLTDVIIAIIFAVLGVAVAVLARRITRVVRNRDKIDDNDKMLVALKAISLVLIFIAFLILVFEIFI